MSEKRTDFSIGQKYKKQKTVWKYRLVKHIFSTSVLVSEKRTDFSIGQKYKKQKTAWKYRLVKHILCTSVLVSEKEPSFMSKIKMTFLILKIIDYGD